MRKILLPSLLIICVNFIYAQKNTSDAFRTANEVIEMLKQDHAHGHHHAHELPSETRLSDVKINDNHVSFYVDIPQEHLQEGYDEMLFEEVGLRLFNSISDNIDANSFELLVKNASGEYVSLDQLHPSVKDEPYQEKRGDGGAEIRLSDDIDYLKNNPNIGQGQPFGALSGKTVWLSPGHGWLYYTSLSGYSTQRGETNDMVEDFGTVEGINYYLLKYLWNAGANVWSVRERDVNENEVVVDNTSGGYTETGAWSTTANTGYNPATTDYDQANGYRFSAVTTGAATSTATWTPNIPKSGWYWVSTTYRSFSDRPVDAQYQVNHAGGTTQVSINQEVHGETWVYLGQFYFDAGTGGSVTLLNSTSDNSPSQFVIADAMRFGGGMGTEDDCTYGAGTTGKPRWEESARMFAPFQGYPTCRGDVTMRPHYAEWELAKGTAQEQANAVYVSWHTNAATGTARGTETYSYNGASASFPITPGSPDLRDFVHNQLAGDIISCYDSGWNDRGTKTANFGEIRELSTMPGCLIEVAFHDEPNDAQALTTPAFREIAARGIYQGIVDYFADADGTTATYVPEQPTHLYAQNSATGSITLTWNAPPSVCGTDAATAYRVYMGTHGRGFADAIPVMGNTYTVSGLNPNTTYYFRVSATNAGGESFPTAVVAARTPASGSTVPYLIVDGFDRIDRAGAVRKTSSSQLTDLRRLFLELMNSYDYMVEHAKALESCGVAFDGVSNEAVIDGSAVLTDYDAVDWFTGEESTVDNSFDATERTLIQNFLDNKGCLIVSGAEIGWDVGRSTSPNADLNFYNNYLKATYVGDDAGTYSVSGVAGGIFAGTSGGFDDNTNCYFDAEFPDRLGASGGSTVELNYVGGTGGGAAIAYKGTDFAVVNFGFPLETADAAMRDALMCQAVDYLSTEHEACATVDLEINFDAAPQQTSWEILDVNGNVVASGGTYGSEPGGSSLVESVCLPDGCYDLVVNDSANDGMCPRRTSTVLTGINIASIGLGGVSDGIPRVANSCGNYTLTDPNGTVMASGGGRFGTSETNGFCLSGGASEFIFQPEHTHFNTTNYAQMRIIPNLVNDQATLYYSLETNEDIHIQLVDITGKIVQQYKRNFDDTNEIQLAVNDLQSGFYFIQLMSEEIMLTEKFVKK